MTSMLAVLKISPENEKTWYVSESGARVITTRAWSGLGGKALRLQYHTVLIPFSINYTGTSQIKLIFKIPTQSEILKAKGKI